MSKERLISLQNDLERNDDGERARFCCSCFKPMVSRINEFWNNSRNFSSKALEMGKKDPRKIIYAVKSGLALSLVSLLIFWKKPSDVSQFSIWAILTVVVMFEFSIGATFIKGFNRGLGTFCAGMLAFLFAWLSLMAGRFERVVIVVSFFMTGAFASYLKLYPTMAPYEYGYRVFVLTFCILMVAGNRTREYTVAILTRLVLIAVGACLCFLFNILIYPIWSGDDLHRLVANNFNELASSLEDCVEGYVKYVDYGTPRGYTNVQSSRNDGLYTGYKTVIESATRVQTLLGFAIWEPPHGRYRKLHYPWKTYVKLNSAIRHCAYSVMALHGCILSEIQAPPEKRRIFRSQLQRVGSEGAKVLREIGLKLEKMERLNVEEDNVLSKVHEAAEQLQKKIDQRSYLLVNSESWEIETKAATNKELEDIDHLQEHDQISSNLHLISKSLSETSVYVKSPLLTMFTPSVMRKDLPKHKLRKHVPWPSWISLEGESLIKNDEVKTYKSASALSLATFASLLIEFVARLQNVVDCFEELSEEAEFVDPDVVVLSENGNCWKRMFKVKS